MAMATPLLLTSIHGMAVYANRVTCCASSSSSVSGFSDSLSSSPGSIPAWKKQQGLPARKVAGVDQGQLLDPWLLADPDSRFAELHGVQIHYKVARPAASSDRSAGTPAILLHGFGASVFTWERVLQPLANLLESGALAFDRPAFGLTSRVRTTANTSSHTQNSALPPSLNPYSLAFSTSATIAFIDFLQSHKSILIGHSAGCIVAADACIKNPERVAALILIAPAIVAPLIMRKRKEEKEKDTLRNMKEEQQKEVSNAVSDKLRWKLFFGRPLLAIWQGFMLAVNKLMFLFSKIKEYIVSFWCRILKSFLRSNIAIWLMQMIMDKCSLQAVHSAWHDKMKVDEYVIKGYTRPLQCRNWEYALLEYIASLVADPIAGKEKGLAQRLGEVSCPVMIVTGDKDRFIPAWNAERLAKVFPKAQHRVIKNCGHLPQEEKPDEILSIVQDFLHFVRQETLEETTFGDSGICVAA